MLEHRPFSRHHAIIAIFMPIQYTSFLTYYDYFQLYIGCAGNTVARRDVSENKIYVSVLLGKNEVNNVMHKFI